MECCKGGYAMTTARTQQICILIKKKLGCCHAVRAPAHAFSPFRYTLPFAVFRETTIRNDHIWRRTTTHDAYILLLPLNFQVV